MNTQERNLLKKFGLDLDDIYDDFSQVTIQRGINYYKTKQVLSIDNVLKSSPKSQDGVIEVMGTVAGSRGYYYNTKLFLKRDIFGLNLSSYCSCPVEIDCKHGIALLFAYLNQEKKGESAESNTDDNVDEWLDSFELLEKERQQEVLEVISDAPTEFPHVIYLLGYDELVYRNGQTGPFVSVVKSKVLKKGGYGKTYPIRHLSDLSVYQDNPYGTELDDKIKNSLQGLSDTTYSYYGLEEKVYLKGKLGELSPSVLSFDKL